MQNCFVMRCTDLYRPKVTWWSRAPTLYDGSHRMVREHREMSVRCPAKLIRRVVYSTGPSNRRREREKTRIFCQLGRITRISRRSNMAFMLGTDKRGEPDESTNQITVNRIELSIKGAAGCCRFSHLKVDAAKMGQCSRHYAHQEETKHLNYFMPAMEWEFRRWISIVIQPLFQWYKTIILVLITGREKCSRDG